MPSKTPILRQEAARRLIGDRGFSAGGDRGPVGSLGRVMMCGTASVQANVDLGSGPDADADAEARWRQAHRIGPTLAAAFANSPFEGGAPSGWRSTRLAVWQALDATRTSPVG